jgi:creatinine amidohydrolase
MHRSKAAVVMILVMVLFSEALFAQSALSAKWEELTGPDFIQAIQKAQGTCMLPFGIIEKHGPQLPLGTDLIDIRYVSEQAANQEYAVIFPPYYFGQIFEARHQPGTVAYSLQLQLELLQETVNEMSRNGCKKIVIVNGHGGNESLLPLFAQSQMASKRDYVVYVIPVGARRWVGSPGPAVTAKDKLDMHAGQTETSTMLIAAPSLVHTDRAKEQSGADQARLSALPEGLYTGIWWYARFPNHYSGDGSLATKELGEFDMNNWVKAVAEAVKVVKADQTSLKLQNEFYEQAQHPLETKQ